MLRAQDTEGDNPTGQAGDYNGEVTTGGSYDPYTQNIKRSITDLVVPGSNGAYPLALSRTYNSMSGPAGGDTAYFGDGGNWRHSYMWTVSPGVAAVGVPHSIPWTVAYPDGATVTFRSSRTTAPAGEIYWRGPAGTSDRLEVDGNDNPKCLHLSDGGIVTFGGGNGFHASMITDPNGAVTKLEYTSGYLSKVTEPGGRWLKFSYNTVYYTEYRTSGGSTTGSNIYWYVLSQVQASTGQTVTYNYAQFGNDHTQLWGEGDGGNAYTTYYYVLTGVNYDSEPSVSGSGQVQASYTYTDLGAPYLTTAHDPHYAGAMVDIRYATNVPLEEQNMSTGQCVSHLDGTPQQPGNNTSTETRGDKAAGGANITRTFVYNGGTYSSTQSQLFYNIYTRQFQSTSDSEATDAKNSQLTSYSDWEGNHTYLYYYPAGDPNGQGNLRMVTDASGNSTSYGHEPYTGKVTAVCLPDGRVRYSTWLSQNHTDAQHPYYLYQSQDERGQTTTYQRDSSTGLVTEIDYPDGSKEQFQYAYFTPDNWATFYCKIYYQKTKLGAEIYYGYGSNPNHYTPAGSSAPVADVLTSVVRHYNDGAGGDHWETTTFQYDSMDRLYQTTDPRGVTTQFSYNARHQLVQTLHVSDGTHTDRAYDDLGNCYYVADELGHSVSTSFDGYRRPTLVVQPVNDGINDHHVDYYSYDPRDTGNNSFSSATSHTRSTWSVHSQQSSRATLRVYSPNNWLTDSYVGMSSAGSIHTTYTTLGQPQTATDVFGYQTTYTYDACNRLISTTDPIGHVSSSTYYGPGETASGGSGANCAGLLKSTTVPGPDLSSPTVTTQMADYDPMGRLRQTIAPTNSYTVSSVTFDSTFNAAGGLTSQDDGAQASGGHVNGYGYDQLGRKVSCSYPDGTAERWTYDTSGNVATYTTRQTNPAQTKTYTYDGRNRLTSTSWSNNAAPAVGYEYDAASRMTRVYNDRSDVHFTYSDAGEVLTETAQLPIMPLKTTTYTHDIDGRVTAILYPHGDQPHFDYDVQGKCTGVWFGNNIYYSKSIYDGKNQLAYRILPATGLVTSYAYQHNGRVSYLWDYLGDANGNHASNGSIRVQCYGYAPGGQVSWTFRAGGYDQSGRNSQLDNNEGDAYYYFADGSLNAAWRNCGIQGSYWPAQQDPTMDARVDPGNLIGCGGPAPSDVRAFPFDPAGNRTSNGNSNYAYTYNPEGENRYQGMGYDANGNTTSPNDGWSYSYNAENQLMSASGPNGAYMLFAYDGLGRLWGDNYNGLARCYYYAGSQRIEEYDEAAQTPLDQYFFDAPGSDSIFLRVDNQRGYLWYLYDAQGNTTHLCDSGGNVLEMYLYDAWGTPTVYDPSGNVRSGGSAWDNRYLFRGADAYQWYTPASLYYCRARFYQPFHGRWLQPDPIGQAGGLNIYAYCGNDPVNESDPSGLWFDRDGNETSGPMIHSYGADAFHPPASMIPAGCTVRGFEDVGDGRHVYIQVGWTDGMTGQENLGWIQGEQGWLQYAPPSIGRGIYNGAVGLFMSLNPMAVGLMAGGGGGHSDQYTDGGWNRQSITETAVLYGPAAVATVATMGAVLSSAVETATLAAEGSSMAGEAGAGGTSGQCFLAGTLVSEQRGKIAIDLIHVGERVDTDNSNQGSSGITAVDSHTWKEVTLRLPNSQCAWDTYNIHALRSPEWMEAEGCTKAGDKIWFEMDELGLQGWAEVQSIDACPPLAHGTGQVVLTTFNHFNTDVYKLRVEGEEQSIEVTGLHRLYSASRNDWVHVENLLVGEKLRTRDGQRGVVALERQPGTFRVYNLEVETDHCYFVSDTQVLAHNAGCNTKVANQIARGHAYGKHVVRQGQYGNITKSDFATHIEAVMDNPTATKTLARGRAAYYDASSGTVVITDPSSRDGGTAFVPNNPQNYYNNLK